MFLSAPKRPVQLGGLVTETTHGVTGVASLILLADMRDQRLRRCTLASSAAINNQSLHIGNVWARLNWQAVVPAKTAFLDEVGNRPEGNRPRGYGFV